MKPLLLKDYTPPKGFMITREATLAERKQIGRETLVKVLAPEIWNMLYDLKGKHIRMQYFSLLLDWCIGRLNGDVRVRVKTYRSEHFYNYDEFERRLMQFDPTFVQRLWKLCEKAIRDEKALRGNERKKAKEDAAMEALREYDKKRRANKPVKIKIDLELQAWI